MEIKNKLKSEVWQVKKDFTTQESWHKIKKLKKDLKCSNCKRLHSEVEGDVALATIKGKLNVHLCNECADFFIGEGAIDIQTKNKILLRTFIEKNITQYCCQSN